ncbi:sphinganine-1-phosphate aldolase [Geosmithia morbida]|uniref:sphinganine-1-phosphate aldolase n=1 Tax=Geosmithia morbida TaxID=1094350 RepID=A0A9P5D4Y7_9HYPO|nr:sphinganine-1-phosphate aldolase [Geosmithia morbida]KAF4121969.1 sphinganine-1-phosphate aldolase [Geosmithia morbida]
MDSSSTGWDWSSLPRQRTARTSEQRPAEARPEQRQQPDNKRRRHYGPRSCRICLEVEQPKFPTDASTTLGISSASSRPVYESDDAELGRLLSPCKCKGSQKYVHEGCLNAWRLANPTATRNYWQCPTCKFSYRMARLHWASMLSSKLTQVALTCMLLVVGIFVLGYIADPLFDLWYDPLGTVTDTVAQVITDAEAQEEPLYRAEEPDTWTEHFAKGFFSLGLVGLFKTMLSMSPFQWFYYRGGGGVLGGSGRRPGATGRARAENMSWVFILIGAATFLMAIWRFVKALSARALKNVSDRVMDLKGRGIIGAILELYANLRRIGYGYFLRAPGVRGKVQRQVRESLSKLSDKLVPTEMTRHLALPAVPLGDEAIRAELQALADMDHTRWEDGFVSGAVYHGEKELMALQTEAFGKFTVANPIHPDVFPGVRKMEAEIVSMVLGLFNAPAGAAGTTTSGGTESILMACLSARQRGYVERGITEPEMILPETGHTAFRKAGEYFGIKVHLVRCPEPDYQVDVRAVSRLINSNTVLLVGSAPNFPHGIIDDIAGLSRLAQRRNVCLHVDCCLGSFLVPFLERAGFETQPFDFRLRGVTSISCDTHKYGFAPKGNSTVLYRTAELRTYQYFVSADWTGGVYASPGIAGSRPGALIAGCWASLVSVGEAGYVDACGKIVGSAKKVADAIRERPSLSAELEVMGRPLVSVIAFTARNLDIYDIADGMSAKGWHLNALQSPPAIHVAVTLPIAKVWEKLVSDLEAVVEDEREKERVRIAEGKGSKGKAVGDSAALYGVAGSLPNKSVVVDLARGFLDILYKA